MKEQTDESAVVAALQRMQLADIDEQPRITPLTGGVSSLIVRADTRRGPVCVKQALPELKMNHWHRPLPMTRIFSSCGWTLISVLLHVCMQTVRLC